MIESDYYKEYYGPDLVLAQIWTHEGKKETITERIREFYGSGKNWNGNLYTYNDVFPGKDHKYKFKVEFLDVSGRRHWFHGMVGDKDQYFNPPLACPMNQNGLKL